MDDDMSTPVPMLERMPGFPYFYHDLVARVSPGTLLLVLGFVWWNASRDLTPAAGKSEQPVPAQSAPASGGEQAALRSNELLRFAEEHPALFLTVASPFALILGYAIGVIYEALGFFVTRGITRQLFGLDFYTWGFRQALADARRRRGVEPYFLPWEEIGVHARETFTVFETFELVASNFYNRGTRFLAEAKLATYSAFSLLASLAFPWCLDAWSWSALWITVGLAVLLAGPAAFARQRRRAVEVIACFDYLRRGVSYPLAWVWVKDRWDQMFAPRPDVGETPGVLRFVLSVFWRRLIAVPQAVRWAAAQIWRVLSQGPLRIPSFLYRLVRRFPFHIVHRGTIRARRIAAVQELAARLQQKRQQAGELTEQDIEAAVGEFIKSEPP